MGIGILIPDTFENRFITELRKAGYDAGFCPSQEWFVKVARHMINKFEITEKSIDIVIEN